MLLSYAAHEADPDFIAEDTMFLQRLGSLGDLRKRQDCEACQILFQEFTVIVSENREDTVDSEIICSITLQSNWFYKAYVSYVAKGRFYVTLVIRKLLIVRAEHPVSLDIV
jgi:hypothetical protein